VSNFAAWQTAKALGIAARNGWAPVVCTQPMYNLVKRQAEAEILPMAQAEGLGVLTYSPLGGGLLSGKYGRQLRPPTGRLVDNAMYRVRYGDESVFAAAERLAAIAAREGVHPATLAIAWVGSRPGVTAPLVGARDLEQLEPCLAAAEFVLAPELREELSALSPAPPPATDRNEETSAHNYGTR
jgi:aryl-alcohol dehydrogenase-like predicted oxidoreductase